MAPPNHIIRSALRPLLMPVAAIALAITARAQQVAQHLPDSTKSSSSAPRVEPFLFELDRLIDDIKARRLLDDDPALLRAPYLRLQREWMLSRLQLIRSIYLDYPLAFASSGDTYAITDSIGGIPISSLMNASAASLHSPFGIVLDPKRVKSSLDSLQRIVGQLPRLRQNFDSLRATLKTKLDSLSLLKDFYRAISGGPFHFGLGFIGNWYVNDIRKYYLDTHDSTIYVDHGVPFSAFISVVMNLEIADVYRLGISVPITELRLSERSSLSGLFHAQIPFGLSFGRVIRSTPPVIAIGAMIHLLPMDELVNGATDLSSIARPADVGHLIDLDLKTYPVRTVTKVGIGLGLFIEL